jgi:hypothetical protein
VQESDAMSTAERSQAYGRVVQILRDVGPAKLLPDEQDVLREAADALFFTDDALGDPDALAAVGRVEDLAAHLMATHRWTPERAAELVDAVVACGLVPLATANVPELETPAQAG